MDLVIDANIIFAIMIKKGASEHLLLANDLHFYAPEYLFIETARHETEILEKTKKTSFEFKQTLHLIEKRVNLIPFQEFRHCINEASRLLEDKADAVYLALCIAKKMPLWSNDKGFKKQDKVKVFNTAELLEYLEIKL